MKWIYHCEPEELAGGRVIAQIWHGIGNSKVGRSKSLNGADGSPFPDDYIPRCMDACHAPRRVWNRPDKLPRSKEFWSPEFTNRVKDAMRRLASGEPTNDIRDIHGAIVVRQAVSELLPKSQMVAK